MRRLSPSCRLLAIPIVLTLFSASCSPKYPTAPDPVIVGLQVFYTQPIDHVQIGGTYAFTAYLVRSDGAYQDVTSSATWLSSDSQIMALVEPSVGGFKALSAGQVDIAARYQSMIATLSIPLVESFSYPWLSASVYSPLTVGKTVSIGVTLHRSGTSPESISNLVTWTSADPSIVRVDGSSVTAVSVGTTVLSTTYNGLTVDYRVSVHPSR